MEVPVHVACDQADDGWTCMVRVGDDPAATTHRVSVSADAAAEFGTSVSTAQRMVEESFAFLLEREPRESILREFDLAVIGRYFPEYSGEMRRRLGG